jgi:hypothetical protein
MTSLKQSLPLLLVLSCLVLSGCGTGIGRNLGGLIVVRSQLVKKYGDEVNVTVKGAGNRRSLIVTYVNSQLNDTGADERAKRAQETAALVKLSYPGIKAVDTISVGFIRQTTRYVVFHYAEGISMFTFDNEARPRRAPEEEDYNSVNGKLDLETRATYIDNAHESDVAVSGIQLEGRPGAGLSLIPHFTVGGDANQFKSKPPKSVAFDFASYSKEEKFQGEVIVKFLVDRNVVLQTKGIFTSWKSSDNIAQFCYLKVPYKAFQRMTAGESLTIKVDEKEYELTIEELNALQRMGVYVKD